MSNPLHEITCEAKGCCEIKCTHWHGLQGSSRNRILMRRNSFNSSIYFLIWLTIVERDKIISPSTNMYVPSLDLCWHSHSWRQNHSEPTEQLVPLSHICSYFKSSDSTAYLMCQRPFQTALTCKHAETRCCFRSLISAGCGCVVHCTVCLPAEGAVFLSLRSLRTVSKPFF